MSDIYLTATTESNPQVIDYWTRYWYSGSSQYWQLQCVAWISQDSTNKTTTIKYKWRVVQSGYYPHWDDSHVYTLSFGGKSDSVSFSLPQNKSDGIRDMCSARTLGTITHDSDGELSGTFDFSVAVCGGYYSNGSPAQWTTTSESLSGSVPPFTPSEPEPTPPTPVDPEPDPPIPLEFDNDPHYYVYCDGELVYSAGIEGREILDPVLTLEVNKAGSFVFDLPVGTEMYGQISKMKSTIEVLQGNEILFRGRLLNTKRNISNTISCYCEGFLAWLNDMTTAPYRYPMSGSSGQARDFLKQIISGYNLRASDNRKLTYVYSDISAKITVESEEYVSLWHEVKRIFIDGIGGYIVPYLTAEQTGIQWLSTYGKTTSQVIQFGKNLLDFEEYIDASQIFTSVRPVGKKVNGSRISLPEMFVNDTDAIERFGRIERIAIFDEITDVSALRNAASEYLRKGIESATTMTLKAADMHLIDTSTERIRLGDSVRTVSVPHGIDAFFICTKTKLKLDHPKDSEYTFGYSPRRISDLTDASYSKYVITEGA